VITLKTPGALFLTREDIAWLKARVPAEKVDQKIAEKRFVIVDEKN
jgi:hypothetical protein